MTEDYLDEVSQAFLSHCGRGLMLSPRDRAIVERWCRAGIPSEVVVAGLNDAFATKPKRRVLSIAFASASVERAAHAWRNRVVGAHLDDEHAEADIEGAFRDLKLKVQSIAEHHTDGPLREVMYFLTGQMSHIQNQGRQDSSFDYDEALETLECQVCDQVILTFNDREKAELELQVNDAVRSMSFASTTAQEQSRTVFRNRRIRARLGLPPLQLVISGSW